MALPSSSRPKEIDELESLSVSGPKESDQLESPGSPEQIIEYLKDDSDDSLFRVVKVRRKKKDRKKLWLAKVEKFTAELNEWYEHRRKEEFITRMELKRVAVRICKNHEMNYNLLPDDWLINFLDKYKIKFKKDRRKRQRKSDTTPRKMRKLVGAGIDNAEVESSSASSSEEDERVESVEPEVIQPSTSSSAPSTSNAEAQSQPSGSSPSAGSSQSKVPEKKVKKLIDLTKDPPPPVWLSAYANGIVLPRFLSLYSTDDANILYYDYSPKLKDQFGREVKLTAQRRRPGDVSELYPK